MAMAAEVMNEVSFVLNGERVSVRGVDAGMTLAEWLRCSAGLTGTKIMCAEGGCGCCVVTGKWKEPSSEEGAFVTAAVNSCLCPLYSVDGWEVTTVEGIGRSADGYHPVQKRIADHNGSQCGYCTPGFVMNMYSLLQTSPCPSKQQVEDAFDGNICRCTGYRPILDGMKSFCDVTDIEDLSAKHGPPRGCFDLGGHASKPRPSTSQWFRATSVGDVFAVLDQCKDQRVKLVAGNTGRGVYKEDLAPEVIVDLRHIAQLWRKEVTADGILVGACVTLSGLIELLQSNADKSASFQSLANHLLKIANVPVRNVATWAGNLMLTRNHDNFPSDIYVMMAAAGAKVTIATSAQEYTSYCLHEFLQVAMDTKLIVAMEIPFLRKGEVYQSYKVMPRAQNAHAYVNCGFRLSLDPASLTVKDVPSLVFGGVSEQAMCATQTASYLAGKVLTDPATLQGAMATLEQEVAPNSPPTAAGASYRKSLACSLFYKFYLSCLPQGVDPRVQSAAIPHQRPLSKGQQHYDTDPSQYPLTQPLTTLSALQQASGEALYTTDVPAPPTQLHAVFVLSTQGNARLDNVDPAPALSLPGVVRYVSARDIPPGGKNNFSGASSNPEEVFAEDVAHYAGQAIGMVIAETQELANKAAEAVKVKYESLGPPILSIKDAIAKESFFKDPDPFMSGEAEDAIASSPCKVSGEVSCGTQYHFTMETQTSLVVPEEDGYSVVASTQWIKQAQSTVAHILGVSASSVNVSVKRVGGGYGSKISRSHQITAACALGAYLTRRPVRMHMDLERNMKMVGKRFPYVAHYKVGFNKDGRINGLKLDLYNDTGHVDNDQEFDSCFLYSFIDNAYNIPNWLINGKICRTHTPCNTWTRSPGSVPAVFIIESVLDHVGKSLGISQEEVRFVNMYSQDDLTLQWQPLEYCSLRSIWQELLTSADVDTRRAAVVQFNKENRWRKRGMSVVPLKYGLDLAEQPFTVFVSIYSDDGTVAIAHAGVEIGQGINIKVAQAAAKTLGIPLDHISMKPSNSLTGPNSCSTGSSITSELNVLGVVRACEELRARIDPVRQRMAGEPTWREVVRKCHAQQVDLSAKGYVNEEGGYPHTYFSYGACCVEVELDVLTGEAEVVQADILYDCGQSMNPEVDVGQVEGAFVMGLGYWLMEDVKYDMHTGELLTHNTWEYKVPCSKDIPVDFRVTLLKNAPNPVGVLRSKAVGEPPQCMSCAVIFALKRAIESAREEAGNTDSFTLSGPATAEVLQQMCLVHSSQFTF